ncbi:MAG TPA: hypothetical protein VLZ29_06365 [Sulfurimonas sp.]|uniref:hypothetical protein n=1 Tax=Sulfurimonas sp. TaxID=2022749 RepID=UPI002C71221B|nr:hypothetical protein [Sulfurimonas sp.]HUH42719.1 hypothetical protein [Sulfurimonas sp.]
MQRKNGILELNSLIRKNASSKRSGFAMIAAIIVIIIIATIMTLSLSLTAQTSKRTVDMYIYEQVALHAKSAAELAMLEIAKNGCTNNLNTTFDDIYDVNVSMRYIYTATVGACNDYFNITTPDQNGSVLMDITVSVNTAQNISTEPIRYFRRTIQKL